MILTNDKVDIAIERLKMFEPTEGYYLAFSGGKDSITVKELTCMAGVKYEAVYNVTTIDPPELIHYMRKHHRDVKWNRPIKPFLKRLIDNGFPLRTRRWCCKEYKESGGTGRLVVTGIRWAESNRRRQRRMTETCMKDGTKTYLHPIIDWTDSDVWEFIRAHNLPYCKLYDEGFKRIGCIMCPMNYNRKKEAARWPGYYRAFKRAFVKLYERRKKEEKPSVNRWKSGEEMFEWWLSIKPRKKDSDQLVIFE